MPVSRPAQTATASTSAITRANSPSAASPSRHAPILRCPVSRRSAPECREHPPGRLSPARGEAAVPATLAADPIHSTRRTHVPLIRRATPDHRRRRRRPRRPRPSLVLGAVAALRPRRSPTAVARVLTAAVAAALLRRRHPRPPHRRVQPSRSPGAPLAVSRRPRMALFALAHVATVVDVDTAILLFSVFLVVARAGAWSSRGSRSPAPGAARRRSRSARCAGSGRSRPSRLGAALGDVPHFGAIAALGAVLGRVRRAHAFSVNRASIRSREPPINGGCATWQAGGGRATRTACCPARPGVWWRSCCPPPVSSRARPCLRPRWPSRPSSMRRPPSSC